MEPVQPIYHAKGLSFSRLNSLSLRYERELSKRIKRVWALIAALQPLTLQPIREIMDANQNWRPENSRYRGLCCLKEKKQSSTQSETSALPKAYQSILDLQLQVHKVARYFKQRGPSIEALILRPPEVYRCEHQVTRRFQLLSRELKKVYDTINLIPDPRLAPLKQLSKETGLQLTKLCKIIIDSQHKKKKWESHPEWHKHWPLSVRRDKKPHLVGDLAAHIESFLPKEDVSQLFCFLSECFRNLFFKELDRRIQKNTQHKPKNPKEDKASTLNTLETRRNLLGEKVDYETLSSFFRSTKSHFPVSQFNKGKWTLMNVRVVFTHPHHSIHNLASCFFSLGPDLHTLDLRGIQGGDKGKPGDTLSVVKCLSEQLWVYEEQPPNVLGNTQSLLLDQMSDKLVFGILNIIERTAKPSKSTSLSIENSPNLTGKTLRIISRFCPNLKQLNIKGPTKITKKAMAKFHE